jgi:type IV secretory pathway VirB4 component
MQKNGITTDVNSLFLKKGGKLDNGKYVIGKIKKKMPTLTDFYNKLLENGNCKTLAKILQPFLRGNSLGLFDCESIINSDTEIICFDMSEIKDEFTKLYASFVVLSWGWQKFILKNRNKKKIIVCDEAWIFLKYKESADFLVNVARRGRKMNTPLYIGSQFIDEFLR